MCCIRTWSTHGPLENARPRLAHGQRGGEHQGTTNPATPPLPKQSKGEESQTGLEQRVAAEDWHEHIEHGVDDPVVEPLEQGIFPASEQFHHWPNHANSTWGWPET